MCREIHLVHCFHPLNLSLYIFSQFYDFSESSFSASVIKVEVFEKVQ